MCGTSLHLLATVVSIVMSAIGDIAIRVYKVQCLCRELLFYNSRYQVIKQQVKNSYKQYIQVHIISLLLCRRELGSPFPKIEELRMAAVAWRAGPL